MKAWFSRLWKNYFCKSNIGRSRTIQSLITFFNTHSLYICIFNLQTVRFKCFTFRVMIYDRVMINFCAYLETSPLGNFLHFVST